MAQSDAELVAKALRKAGTGSNKEVADKMGVSDEQVRRWRMQLAAGQKMARVNAPVREALRRYLAGEAPGVNDPHFWRQAVVQAEHTARELADQLAAVLATGKPLD